MSHLISTLHWGSGLTLLEVCQPPRTFFPVFPYMAFATLRDGPLRLRSSGSKILTWILEPDFESGFWIFPLLVYLFSRSSCALPQ